jgi:hypothetical protein
LLAIVALLGVCLAVGLPIAVRQSGLIDGTVYPAGFDEDRFARVRPGMTVGQVEALIGPAPIRWVKGGGAEIWAYSDNGSRLASRYQRRWVHVYLGLVTEVERGEVVE